MTICHILTYTYENGGTSKFVYELASYQAGRGDTVKILSTDTVGQTPYPVPNGVELISFEPEMLTKAIPLYSSDLRDYVKKNEDKIDALHLHCLWNYGEMLVDKLGLYNKTIITIHGSLHPYTFEGLVYYKRLIYSKWFQLNFVKKARVIHALHNGEAKDIESYIGYSPKQLVIIPNGMEIKDVSINPPEKRNNNQILFISRLHHKKGVDILMPAFKLVLEKIPEAKLLIAGPDDGMLTYVNDFIRAEAIEKSVELLGTVTGTEKEHLFQSVGVFVLPSYSEGFSIAVLEALNYGLPAVVSDQTGLSPMLENYQAALVPELTPEAFANALVQVLSDATLAKTLAINGRKLLEERLEQRKICKEFNDKIYNQFRL